MDTGRPSKATRRVAAAAVAAGLALVVSGCGGDGGGADGKPSARAAAPKDTGRGTPAADSQQAIGEVKGPDGVSVTLHSAVRDTGGFVTVTGTVTNHGSKIFNAINWRSNETGMRSRSSVSGATLVDKAGKKRYLVLRDTEGECLCTTGLSGLKPGESRPVFAQFPAPPAKVTEVDFQLPTMPPATVSISD
ncbi:hypothetical protein A6A06_03675 [Streptomyces sp. CB02923]|uniref:hypothetical protein n=1 Tax=Streptomyces sp. CB02923 TaxID=1718985 RepID=UPI000939427A|nr:hypothetical protein [Streptomyces sp. CB02923]OKI09759.1 hypothetical protein A6A06_03675 [Streptomyces sp. CB02923]